MTRPYIGGLRRENTVPLADIKGCPAKEVIPVVHEKNGRTVLVALGEGGSNIVTDKKGSLVQATKHEVGVGGDFKKRCLSLKPSH